MAVILPYVYGFLYNVAIAAAASAIANALAGTRRVDGPRLNDLKLQTSTYGNFIPIVYGTMGLAGNVIFVENNELAEGRITETQGGKGGQSVKTRRYVYFATVCVGICEGPITDYRRIWANNLLIFDKSGNATTESFYAADQLVTNIIVYPGEANDPVDPRMQITRPNTPAYRGVAKLLVEDFQLEKFGNSIPSFRVEVTRANIERPTLIEDLGGRIFNDPDWLPAFIDEGIVTWYEGGRNFNTSTTSTTINLAETTITGVVLDEFQRTIVIDTDPDSSPRFNVPVRNSDLILLSATTNDGLLYDLSNGNVYELTPPPSISPRTLADIIGEAAFRFQKGYFYEDNIYALSGFGAGNTSGSLDSAFVFGWLDKDTPLEPFDLSGVDLGECFGLYVDNNGVYTQQTQSGGFVITRLRHDLSAIDKRWFVTGSIAASNSSLEISVTTNGRLTVAGTSDEVFVYQLNEDETATFLGSNTFGGPASSQRPLFFTKDALVLRDKSIYAGDRPSEEGPLLSTVVDDLMERAGIEASRRDNSDLIERVKGYVARRGNTLDDALQPLQVAYTFDVFESEYQIKSKARGDASVLTLTDDDLGARENNQELEDILVRERQQEVDLPRAVYVKYASDIRNYDTGEQYDSRQTVESEHIVDVQLPIVLTDDDALNLAKKLLYAAWQNRTNNIFKLSFKHLALEPADVITLSLTNLTVQCRINRLSAGFPGILEIEAEDEQSAIYTQTGTAATPEEDTSSVLYSGKANTTFLDIQLLRDIDQGPGYYVAVNGFFNSFPGAVLFKSFDDGDTFNELAPLVNEAGYGTVSTALPAGSTDIPDTVNTLTVFMRTNTTLSTVTDLQFFAGVNAGVLGRGDRWEIIKWRDANLIATSTYELTYLARGYRGTEHNVGNHIANEIFIPLSVNTINRIQEDVSNIGNAFVYKSVPLDSVIARSRAITFTYNGVGLKPYSPVHVSATRNGSEDAIYTWIRRTRIGGEWREGVNAELSETTEAYEIDILDALGGNVLRTITGLTSPTATYTAAQQTTDFGSPQALGTIPTAIYQISSVVGRGFPATGLF